MWLAQTASIQAISLKHSQVTARVSLALFSFHLFPNLDRPPAQIKLTQSHERVSTLTNSPPLIRYQHTKGQHYRIPIDTLKPREHFNFAPLFDPSAMSSAVSCHLLCLVCPFSRFLDAFFDCQAARCSRLREFLLPHDQLAKRDFEMPSINNQ